MSWLGPKNPFGPLPELIGLLMIMFGDIGKETRLILFGCFGLVFCSCCAGTSLIVAALIIRSR